MSPLPPPTPSPPSPKSGRAGAYLAGAVVFAASFLLFVLELATAKALLPRFGGSPMVWTTSMLVYQILLVAGYAHAHGLARLRSPKRQAALHVLGLLMALAYAIFRMGPGLLEGGDPGDASRQPMRDVVLTLLGTMALPFLAVSATSPLVQHWRQKLAPGRSVFGLYAVSNVGSFTALVAYPFLIEPWFGLPAQFALWRILFSLVCLGLGLLAWQVARSPASDPIPTAMANEEGVGRGRKILWFALPAGTSALLLAATNELCQDLAVFPFLWVLPLGLYLLSFSISFRSRPLAHPLPWAALATLAALSTTSASLMLPAMVHILAIGSLVFVLCLAAHREVYRLRPAGENLTAYYLAISAGSGLGAAAVALLAPAFFLGFWEFHAAILLLWIGLLVADALNPAGTVRVGDRRQALALWLVLLYFIANRIPETWLARWIPAWPSGWSGLLRVGMAVVAGGLLWQVFPKRRLRVHSPVWPRVLVGLVLFFAESALVEHVRGSFEIAGVASRNFFGIVRVQDMFYQDEGIYTRQLTHGRINHGWQYLTEDLVRLPTAYHSPSTGIGRILEHRQSLSPAIHIGVTGLGAGALAAYPREADRLVFYEIDPQVVSVAAGPNAVFDFTRQSPGSVEIVLGDARQSLASELRRSGSRQYDVLALDAFSGDAIPMHLLTREAFALYFDHLVPDGVLAVNISNRFLDIEPVLADIAAFHDAYAVLVDCHGDPPLPVRSIWVMLSRDPASLAIFTDGGRPLVRERLAWTDSHASPIPLFKWWSPSSRKAAKAKARAERP